MNTHDGGLNVLYLRSPELRSSIVVEVGTGAAFFHFDFATYQHVCMLLFQFAPFLWPNFVGFFNKVTISEWPWTSMEVAFRVFGTQTSQNKLSYKYTGLLHFQTTSPACFHFNQELLQTVLNFSVSHIIFH